MRKLLLILLVSTCVFKTSQIIAQQGTLDVTFGNGGKVVSKVSSSTNYGTCTAIQKDGKIIIGGYSWLNGYEFTLVRYLVNGIIDSTFGTNGITVITYLNFQSYGHSLKIQADDRIILAGNTWDGFGKNSFAIARFTPDGYPDYSFGFGGFINTPYPNDNYVNNTFGVSLTIQNDGKYLLAGNLSHASSRYFSLIRYNNNGAIDTIFGLKGWVITKFNTKYDTLDFATTVLVQPDNKIVLTGYAEVDSPYTATYHFAIARYDSIGTPDTTFGINGQIVTNSNRNAYAYSALIQPDNKILLAGAVLNYSQSSYDFALARYMPDGKPDSSFGTNGFEITPLDSSSNSIINSITLQPDGKILAGGQASGDFALVRYNSNGTFDTSFGIHGQVYTNFGTGYDLAQAIALQTDGKIILAGDDGGLHIEAARYNGNNVVLPLNLLSFTAIKSNKEVIVKWTTANAIINNYFILQRSIDGVSFTNIEKVKATANISYLFTDNPPVPTYQPVTIYYRLQMFDLNGEFIYSPIKNLNYNPNSNISLFPNPVKTNVNLVIANDRNEKAEILIMNIQGKLLSQTHTDIFKGMHVYNFNVSSLTGGTYLIRIVTSKHLDDIKFIKY